MSENENNFFANKTTEQRHAFGFWFAVGLLLIAIDQVTKFIAVKSLRIFYNDAFAFSLPLPALVMYTVYSIVFAVIVSYLLKNYQTLARPVLLGWTFIIAGGLSNVGERIIFGSVRDFIPIGSGMLNVADFYILAGILAVLLGSHKK